MIITTRKIEEDGVRKISLCFEFKPARKLRLLFDEDAGPLEVAHRLQHAFEGFLEGRS